MALAAGRVVADPAPAITPEQAAALGRAGRASVARVDEMAARLSLSAPTRKQSAWVYVGYYEKYAFGAPAVCKSVGVDLGTFTAEWERLNAPVLATAGRLIELGSARQMARKTAFIAAQSELTREGKMIGGGPRKSCGLIAQKPLQIARGAQFSIVFPAMSHTLMAGMSR